MTGVGFFVVAPLGRLSLILEIKRTHTFRGRGRPRHTGRGKPRSHMGTAHAASQALAFEEVADYFFHIPVLGVYGVVQGAHVFIRDFVR